MKLHLKPSPLACSAIALLATAGLSLAQLPVSRQAINVPVSVTGASAATPISVPGIQDSVTRDIVSAVASPVITGTAGGYGALAGTHMVLIKTGPGYGTGLPITSNTATTLTVSGAIPALEIGADEFEIVPLQTIASVFGSSTSSAPLDLTGSSGAASADIVLINGVRYFYKTSGANAPGWKLESAPNAVGDLGSTVIGNLRGVVVIRKAATTTVNIRGFAREGRAVLQVPSGTTLLSWPFPQETSLLNSKLQNTITGSSGAAGADKVIIDGVRYFYKNSGANSPGWKLESAPNAAQPGANNIVLNPGGRGFVVIRAGAEVGHPAEEAYAP